LRGRSQDLGGDENRLSCYEKTKSLIAFILDRWGWMHRDYHGYIDLDDVFQEARIALWQATAAYDKRRGTKFSTFGARVVQNKLSNLKKRLAKEVVTVPIIEEVHKDGNSIFDVLIAETRLTTGKTAERALPILLLMRDGLDIKEIGENLGISPSSVRKRLRALGEILGGRL